MASQKKAPDTRRPLTALFQLLWMSALIAVILGYLLYLPAGLPNLPAAQKKQQQRLPAPLDCVSNSRTASELTACTQAPDESKSDLPIPVVAGGIQTETPPQTFTQSAWMPPVPPVTPVTPAPATAKITNEQDSGCHMQKRRNGGYWCIWPDGMISVLNP